MVEEKGVVPKELGVEIVKKCKEIARELENIKKDNSETEGKLKVKERQVELIRLNYTNTMGTAGSFADETEAIKDRDVTITSSASPIPRAWWVWEFHERPRKATPPLLGRMSRR